ncbi:hypothetical protein COO60DRAFT_656548 [Scenedesmus sp. NREL 46B-D3]|nr:hypothetical protein COO60DRAFT_656548 [Scenedesmus sp. NREL 46B-D3]
MTTCPKHQQQMWQPWLQDELMCSCLGASASVVVLPVQVQMPHLSRSSLLLHWPVSRSTPIAGTCAGRMRLPGLCKALVVSPLLLLTLTLHIGQENFKAVQRRKQCRDATDRQLVSKQSLAHTSSVTPTCCCLLNPWQFADVAAAGEARCAHRTAPSCSQAGAYLLSLRPAESQQPLIAPLSWHSSSELLSLHCP